MAQSLWESTVPSSKCAVVGAVLFGLLSVAAGRQLAMMVDVKPLAADERGTLAEIVVRVAPEDRFALGEDVMLWAELARDGQQIVRRGWALKVEDRDEPLRVELVVPPGPHSLRVDLEGSSARSRGVWWGDVNLSSPSPDPDPDPGPVPDDPATATATASASATVSETASETVPIPVPVPAPVPDDPETATATATATASVSAFVSASESATETAAATAGVDPGAAADPVPVLVSEPVAVPASAPAPAAAADPPTLVIAVDLHAETAPNASWIGRLAAGLAQQTTKAPEEVLIISQGGESLSRPTSWTELADQVAVIETGPADELSTLVSAALRNTVRDGDSTFVLVLTDGLGSRAKKGWSAAQQAAEDSDVSVLIAGIWSDGFPSGMRKDLRKLAEVSHGSVFYLQGPEQAEVLVERFVLIVAE